MHRSRLTALGIDVPSDRWEVTTEFWAGALGLRSRPGEGGTYAALGRVGPVEVFVQRLGEGGPRLHLDIETDDVEAETARLEALGAGRVEMVDTWWIMRDPGGNVFCVVPPQTDDFPEGTTTWP